jgi:putative transposase
MSITRRITFRLYPSQSQAVKLNYWRRLHKDLYNACLAHRQVEYRRNGRSISYYDQQNLLPEFKQEWGEYIELGSHALQATVKRVDFAYQRFFKGLGGYPKFKSSRHYQGWTYPCKAGWKTHTTGKNGYLELSNLGQIQMRGQARTWGTPTTCTLMLKNGLWYVSITVVCEPVRATGIGSIGADFGCLTAVALSDGTKIENPRFLAVQHKKIKRVSKSLRRKRKPEKRCALVGSPDVKSATRQNKAKASRRWRKVKNKVRKLHQKVARQRQNWCHQVAVQIVSSNSMVATEKLTLKNMTRKAKKGSKRKRQKTGLNRSILDVGMGMLRSAIEYKLAEANGIFIEIPTQKVKPSQTCPNCGHQQKKDLSEREHLCSKCGYQADRDVAAAQVMLSWALGTSVLSRGESGSTSIPTVKSGCNRAEVSSACVAPSNCGGFKQLVSTKRQKPQPSEVRLWVVHSEDISNR